MRLTIVQYAGDYREAFERFERGGRATYQAQRYSVGFVGSLADQLDQVAVVCALTESPYDIVLPNGVRAVGAGFKSGFHSRDLVPLVARTTPDRLVLATPMVPLLKWARTNRVPTIATLADSFQEKGLRSRIRHWGLAAELNRANVAWVGNHGIAACLSLLKIGVDGPKIIPWDWPPSHRPSEHCARTRGTGALRLAYVGTVSEQKGVGDLLHALALLRAEGLRPQLTIVGHDAEGRMNRLAADLALNDQVRFAGLIPNEDIPSVMRSADVVVIPSRHEYPEGLPLTIYEALASRTPIIASDHPMFFGALEHLESAFIFPAAKVGELAASIRTLNGDAALYARLSSNSEKAWNALQLPVIWGDLITNWLKDHSLLSGLYREQIGVRSRAPA